jgi:hypothetical protein
MGSGGAGGGSPEAALPESGVRDLMSDMADVVIRLIDPLTLFGYNTGLY